MSKKMAEWVEEILGAARTPTDDFTWSDGSNFGLDGFGFLQTMNEGVLDGARLPTVHGLSALPDGFVKEAESPFDVDGRDYETGGTDLSEFLSEAEGALPLTAAQKKAVSLMDLSWLDPTQQQDPARLPKGRRPDQPPLNSTPELIEAWGVNRRTDGLRLVPNRDCEILQYEQSIHSDVPATPGVEKNAVDMGEVLRKALRRATYGHPLQEIKAEVHQMLGPHSARALQACKLVEADYGLAGTVFLRANAFPGLKQGNWDTAIKKAARSARYLLSNDPVLATRLGMVAVAEVPWKVALRYYQPRLAAARFRVAAQGDPKEILRQAFLSGPEAAPRMLEHKPVDVRPADRVSTALAKRVFAATPKEPQQVITVDRTPQERQAALVRIAKYVQANQLSRADALRLGTSQAQPEDLLKTAAALVQANRIHSSKYAGSGTLVPKVKIAGHDEAWAALRAAEKGAAAEDRKLEAGLVVKAKARIAGMVKSGALTQKEAVYAVQRGQTADEMLKLAAAIVQQAGTERKPVMRAIKASEFQGPTLTAAPQQAAPEVQLPKSERLMLAAAKTSGIKLGEFRALATWMRRQMTEGLMGNDLTSLMKMRFAMPLRKAGAGLIKELRAAHEGLSGVLYVDTEAYASSSGSAGCEKFASKHRTNQIKFAKAMPRCASCTFKNANGTCLKYGKPLLERLPANAAELRLAHLREADAPDFEATAALFNSNEFRLTSSLDHIALESEPELGSLEGVTFGDWGAGMTLDTDPLGSVTSRCQR